jgi:D-alanine-D-alanine ligase
VLLSQELMPPDAIPDGVEKEKQSWRTEYDVISTLKSMGHEVYPVGLRSDLALIANAREECKPHIVFNLLEDFDGQALFDQHVVSYLELLKQPYTGCNPRGLTLAHDKALTKKILSYHRIAVRLRRVSDWTKSRTATTSEVSLVCKVCRGGGIRRNIPGFSRQ